MARVTRKQLLLIAACLIVALALSYVAIDHFAEKRRLADTFNAVYADGVWGMDAKGQGKSGPGSTLRITREYRAFVEGFIKTNGVKSVVDAGCGDWTFSSAMDWAGANYLGIDVSSKVIELVRKQHERGNIKFAVGDITEDLPSADLLLCKDVLQHIPNALIAKFIKNNLRKGKYKWVILTNDRGGGNPDIQPGEHRLIDLSAPPFQVSGLVDLPIKYETEPLKITSLLDFTQQP